MIEFTTVTREFRSLIRRRQMMMTFLGSLYAATGLFLHNVLKSKLPPVMDRLKEDIFAFYALMVMVPTLILALRMAKLHGGLTINGVLYARLMQEQDFTTKGNPERAARHNFLGVSFLQFLLTNLLAAGSATVLAFALGATLPLGCAVGAGVFIVWLGLYLRFHHQAAVFALKKIKTDVCGPFDKKDWQEHVSSSLEEANTGMLSDIAFVALMMFSGAEKLSSLGDITPENAGPASGVIIAHGPLIYTLLMLIPCLFGLLIYTRVRVAVGAFSLQLDPSDRPFRALRLTDSLLGYLLLAFLFTVSLHMLLMVAVPWLEANMLVLVAIDGGAFLLAVVAEQLALAAAGRHFSRFQP